ncbi:MAG: caspase family protein [Elusimicrobiota bacterium]
MSRPLAAALAACLLLSGCASTPRPVDPFGAKPPASPYKELTLALMISQNTKDAIEYGRMGRKWARRLGGWDFDPEGLFEDISGMLQRDFKKVFLARRLKDAAASGADVVAVVDIRSPKFQIDLRYAWLMNPITFPIGVLVNMCLLHPGVITVDNGAIFLTPNGRQLESLRVVHIQRRTGRMDVKIRDAYLQARYDLERELLASEPLRNYAEAVRAKGAAAANAGFSAIRSDVDRPAFLHPVEEDLFAVVVGVEAYDHSPRAAFAERDAQAVLDNLLALGYPRRNIAYAVGTAAGRAAVEKYVESWLPERVGKKSRVLFYFAGHGAPDVESGERYLLPSDGDPRFLASTGYPLKRLYEKLAGQKARQVVVLLDAGFSGTGGRSVLPKGARPLVMEVKNAVPANLSVLTAAAASEKAGAATAQGHGLFTYHFLKALQSEEGKAKLKELRSLAAKAVADAARRENREQTVRLIGDGGVKLR